MAALVACLMLVHGPATAQYFERVIPMGKWAVYKEVPYDGRPIVVHLRTGYERAVVFPEPVTLLSVDKKPVAPEDVSDIGTFEFLPDCPIAVDNKLVGFSPLARFKATIVELKGNETDTMYSLLVSSSHNGSRQPIDVKR